MEDNSRVPKKRYTSVGIICELAKTKSQENYLYGVQRKAVRDLILEDISPNENESEKRLLAEIELQLEQFPERFQKDKKSTQEGVLQLKEKIKHLNDMADNVHQYDLKTYRDFVLDIENAITELNNANKLTLSKLKFDYMDIVADLPEPADLLREEQKFMKRKPKPLAGSWTKHTGNNGQTDRSTCDYKEIQIFDRFLQTRGGHSGGWSDEQHSIYLHLKSKYKANLVRIEECFKEILPDIDTETIKRHDDWFQEYTTLKSNRKRAIEQWKKDKNV